MANPSAPCGRGKVAFLAVGRICDKVTISSFIADPIVDGLKTELEAEITLAVERASAIGLPSWRHMPKAQPEAPGSAACRVAMVVDREAVFVAVAGLTAGDYPERILSQVLNDLEEEVAFCTRAKGLMDVEAPFVEDALRCAMEGLLRKFNDLDGVDRLATVLGKMDQATSLMLKSFKQIIEKHAMEEPEDAVESLSQSAKKLQRELAMDLQTEVRLRNLRVKMALCCGTAAAAALWLAPAFLPWAQ